MCSFVQNVSFCWVYFFYLFLFVSQEWSVGEFFEPVPCNVLSFHTCVGMKKDLMSVTWHSRTHTLPRCVTKCKHFLLYDSAESCTLLLLETLSEYRESPNSTKHLLCTMTYYSRSQKSLTRVKCLLRRCISFLKGRGVRLNKYLDAKICFVAKLEVMWQQGMALVAEQHLFILENKCFV
jgi:hypothetical protein